MDNKTPLISVIVPAYNTAKFVGKCIESIQNNSYKNLEIIIVNDGSADNTADVVSAYAAKDDRIVLINKENGGVSSARNAGIDVANGEYIAFVDSDDYITEDFFEALIKPCIEQGAESACCVYAMVDVDGKVMPDKRLTFEGDRLVAPNEIAINYFAYSSWGLTNFVGRMHKRSAVGDIRFSETLKYGEDGSFNLVVFKNMQKIYFTSKVMYFYVAHSQQATANKMENFGEMIIERNNNVAGYIDHFGGFESPYTRCGMGMRCVDACTTTVYHSNNYREYKAFFKKIKLQPWYKYINDATSKVLRWCIMRWFIMHNCPWGLYVMCKCHKLLVKIKKSLKRI